jgi:hypothetical protein
MSKNGALLITRMALGCAAIRPISSRGSFLACERRMRTGIKFGNGLIAGSIPSNFAML